MSLLSITNESMKLLAKHIVSCGDIGITSIGCGIGELEAKLANYVKEVHCIDFTDYDELCTNKKNPIVYTKLEQFKDNKISIPLNHAILFCFPTYHLPFEKYVKIFKGRCIITISDNTCDPPPRTHIEGFEIIHLERFPAPDTIAYMVVYRRNVFIKKPCIFKELERRHNKNQSSRSEN